MTSIAAEIKSLMSDKYGMKMGTVDLPILAEACQDDPSLVPVVSMIFSGYKGHEASGYTEFAKSLLTTDGLSSALGRDILTFRRPGHMVTAVLSVVKKPLSIETAKNIYGKTTNRDKAEIEFPYYEVSGVVQLTDAVSRLLDHDARLSNPALQLTELFVQQCKRYI